MPKATIWIRVENEDRWNAIKDKSAFINSALRPASFNGVSVVEVPVELKTPPTFLDWSSEHHLTPRSSKVCKNGHPIPESRDRCLGKGCKYG